MSESETPAFAPPLLTIQAAAEACNISTRTVRRYLSDEKFPSAYKAPDPATKQDRWLIPITDLLSAGLKLTTPEEAAALQEPAPTDRVAELELELERTRAELRMQTALATEREKALEDARLALRALAAGPPVEPAPEAPQPAPEPAAVVVPSRLRWPFRRRPGA